MKSFKLISAVFVLCLLILSFSITSASLVSEVPQTISSSGMIKIPAVMLFEAGFETGDLSEVDTETAYNGVVEITAHAFSGQYAARCYGLEMGTPAPRARINPKGYFIGYFTEVNIRAFFYFKRLDGYVQCIRTSGHTDVDGTGYYVYIARTVVSQGYVRLQLGMSGKNPGDWWPIGETGPVEITVHYTFELEKWYCIEQRFVKGVNGEARIWVDGEEVISYSGDTSNSPDVRGEVVGIVLCSAETDIYVDNFVVAKGYIGP